MTIERREEYAEVVSSDAADVRPVDVSTSGPAGTTTHQTETFTSDPYAVRREVPSKCRTGIYLLFGILEGLLGIRFVLESARRQPGCGLCAVHLQHHEPVPRPVRGAVRDRRASRAACSM